MIEVRSKERLNNFSRLIVRHLDTIEDAFLLVIKQIHALPSLFVVRFKPKRKDDF
jgi:hypothetical protein